MEHDAMYSIPVLMVIIKSEIFTSCYYVFYHIQAIAGGSPRSHLEPLTDILFSLNKNYITQLSAWLQVCVSQIVHTM